MSSRWRKKDAHGQVLHPGDVCIRMIRDSRNFNKSHMEYVVYQGESWGGNKSKGEFGRFITPGGTRSIKYTSVLFAFDPMGERKAKTEQVTSLVREFYEGK